MTLSPSVGRSSPRDASRSRPSKRRTPGPFGSMNMRTAEVRDGRGPRSAPEASGERPSSRRDSRKKPVEDFKALKMHRALAPVPYSRRSTVKDIIRDIESFDQFSLLPIVREAVTTQALAGLQTITPTPVQRVAIPTLLGEGDRRRKRVKEEPEGKKEMGQYLIAAETGSGKTLAYLLPVIDAMKRAEVVDAEKEAREKVIKEQERQERMARNIYEFEPPPLSGSPHSTTARPRVIILLPTSELVSQVGSVMKLLSHKIKYRSAFISSAYSSRVIRNRLFSTGGIDILVATPHLLASIAQNDPFILSRVSHLVIDEADSLLDRSFAPTTSEIIDRTSPSLKQLILCSATIPRSLDSYLRQRYPDIKRLVTPNLHAIPRRVQLGVVDVEKDPYRGNKNLACADSIYTIGKAAMERASSAEKDDPMGFGLKRIIVFVNEREKTQEVAEYLVSKGIDALALNRDTPEQRQSEILATFTVVDQSSNQTEDAENAHSQAGQPNFSPATASASPSKRTLPNTKVLVCTDLGSRGIDTIAVRHVILYDVPHSSIDFIHRLGRTGRMGRRGRGIVLVGKGDRRDVVREVREGMFKGQALI
ncbi:MAG: RNA helicase [Chaenotheca gracillima]|nr:MAG: RNA helicase [Chaenotheca gracillima]